MRTQLEVQETFEEDKLDRVLTHPECNTHNSLSGVSLHPHLEHLLAVLDINDPDGPV